MSADVSALVHDYLAVVESKDSEIFRLVEEQRKASCAAAEALAEAESARTAAVQWQEQAEAAVRQLQLEAERASSAEASLQILRPFASHVASLLNCKLSVASDAVVLERETMAITDFLRELVHDVEVLAPQCRHFHDALAESFEDGKAFVQSIESASRRALRCCHDDVLSSLKASCAADEQRVLALEAQRATYCHVAQFAAEAISHTRFHSGFFFNAAADELGGGSSSLQETPAPSTLSVGSLWQPDRVRQAQGAYISLEESAAAAFANVSKLKAERNMAIAEASSAGAEVKKLLGENTLHSYSATKADSALRAVCGFMATLVADYQQMLLDSWQATLHQPFTRFLPVRLSEAEARLTRASAAHKEFRVRSRHAQEEQRQKIEELEGGLLATRESSAREIAMLKMTINELRGRIADSIRREAHLRRGAQAAEVQFHEQLEQARREAADSSTSANDASTQVHSLRVSLERSAEQQKRLEKNLKHEQGQRQTAVRALAECEDALGKAHGENAQLRAAISDLREALAEVRNQQRDEVKRLENQLAAQQQSADREEEAHATSTRKLRATIGELRAVHEEELAVLRSRVEKMVFVTEQREREWLQERDGAVCRLREANVAQAELIAELKSELSAAKLAVAAEKAARAEDRAAADGRVEAAELRFQELERSTGVRQVGALTQRNDELQKRVRELELACEISVKQITELREALHMGPSVRSTPTRGSEGNAGAAQHVIQSPFQVSHASAGSSAGQHLSCSS